MASHSQKIVARACVRLLEPVATIFLSLGAGAGEFAHAAKTAHVRATAKALRNNKQRLSQSRIAVVTGLTRAEVRRLLNERGTASHAWHRNRALRVLDGWQNDKEFRGNDGKPTDISIRGRSRSLEKLVKRYAGDIPLRAVLDELLAAKAVVRLPRRMLRRTARAMSKSRPHASRIEASFSTAQALLETVAQNLAEGERRTFEGTVTSQPFDDATADYLEAFLSERARAFLQIAADQFAHPPTGARMKKAAFTKLGIHVFFSRNRATDRYRRGA